MPEVQAQIQSVYSRTTSKGTVYDITLGDGSSKSTWDAATAAALQQYAGSGQFLSIRFTQKQSRDGRFVNETISAFAPPGQQLAPEVQVNGPMQGQQLSPAGGMQPGVMQQPQIPQAPPKGFDDPQVVIRVVKLNCLETAANYVGHLLHGAGPEAAAEGLTLIKQIAEQLYSTARSHENAPVAPPAATSYQTGPQGQVTASQPLTGAQIASQVPGVSLGAPQPVDVGQQDPSEWD